jgi:protein O-mannosyl-transferase
MSLSRVLPILLVALVAVVAVAPALDGRFIYDDQYYLVGNPAVRGEASPWTTPLGSPQQALWRPLTVVSFALQWQGPEAAGPLRAVNVALHALTAVLLLLLARRLGLPGEVAVLAALLFAVHPVHAEAVAWVSGRAELLAAALVFASWLAWLAPGRLAAVACAVLFAAALLSKENALVAPLLFAAGDVLIRRRPVARGRLIALGAVAAGVWAARLAVLPQALPAGAPFGDVSLAGRLVVAANILGEALRQCVLPGEPRVFHPRSEFLGPQAGPLLALAAAAAVVALCWRRQRTAAGALLLVPLALLTVLNLLPIGATFAARFLYLPSACVCLAAGALLAALARRELSGAGLGASVLLAGAALTLGLSACRDATRVFSTDLALWAHEAAVAPRVAHARYNHGYFLQESGRDLAVDRDRPGAADELAVSLELDPDHLYAGFAHQMLGNIALGAAGRGVPDLPLAAEHFREALERLPDLLDARINLATIAAAAPSVVSAEEGLETLQPLRDAPLTAEQARVVDALRAQLSAAGRGDSPDSSTGTSSPEGS